MPSLHRQVVQFGKMIDSKGMYFILFLKFHLFICRGRGGGERERALKSGGGAEEESGSLLSRDPRDHDDLS